MASLVSQNISLPAHCSTLFVFLLNKKINQHVLLPYEFFTCTVKNWWQHSFYLLMFGFLAMLVCINICFVFKLLFASTLSVLRGHLFFHPCNNSQWSPTSKDSYPRFWSTIFFCSVLIPGKEPVFPFSMLSAKQGNYWYQVYNVFGMTGDWTPGLP